MICGQIEVIFFRTDGLSCGHPRIITLEQILCPRLLKYRSPESRAESKRDISESCGMGKTGNRG